MSSEATTSKFKRLREAVERLPSNDSTSYWKEEIHIRNAAKDEDKNMLRYYAIVVHCARILLHMEEAEARLVDAAETEDGDE